MVQSLEQGVILTFSSRLLLCVVLRLVQVPLTSELQYAQESLKDLPCNELKGLSKGQRQMCYLYHDHIMHIGKGARMGIRECQWQFKNRRWNCSTIDDTSVIGPLLTIGMLSVFWFNYRSSLYFFLLSASSKHKKTEFARYLSSALSLIYEPRKAPTIKFCDAISIFIALLLLIRFLPQN